MRDQRAPVINRYDFSGLTNRYSFQCEPYYEEGGNGGTFLDGSTVKDVLAVKERLSWTLNSMTAQQYADMCAALNSGETPDLAEVVFKDPALNAVRKAAFHVVTRPPFIFSKEEPYFCTKAGAALILEESYPIERYAFTPPNQTEYAVGDSFAFALTGMSVTAYDPENASTVITPQCVVSPADGSLAGSVGNVPVSVSYQGMEVGTFTVNVAELEIVASGDWWELYNNGKLRVFCEGDMPNFGRTPPWSSADTPVRTAVLTDGVTSIGNYAFQRCESLSSVTIPAGVTSIGDNAFLWCRNLTAVTLPASVTSIGDTAFRNCLALKSVTIPNGVTSIGDNVFEGCESLESVTIPASVTSIGNAPFHSCFSLTNAVILNSMTSITAGFFFNCESLVSVTIPDTVIEIGNSAFYRCVDLADVYFSGTQAQWEAISVGSDNSALARATIHCASEEVGE